MTDPDHLVWDLASDHVARITHSDGRDAHAGPAAAFGRWVDAVLDGGNNVLHVDGVMSVRLTEHSPGPAGEVEQVSTEETPEVTGREPAWSCEIVVSSQHYGIFTYRLYAQSSTRYGRREITWSEPECILADPLVAH